MVIESSYLSRCSRLSELEPENAPENLPPTAPGKLPRPRPDLPCKGFVLCEKIIPESSNKKIRYVNLNASVLN